MEDRPQNASIRSGLQLSSSLGLILLAGVLGAGITVGGFVLAGYQDRLLQAREVDFAAERAKLSDALRHARLTAPRLRLEELANLPLVAEYISLAADEPDSTDTKELYSYLQTVLEATLEESGLANLNLSSVAGDRLITVSAPQVTSSDNEAFTVEVAVPDVYGSGETVGRLSGAIASEAAAVLASPYPIAVETTASIQERPGRWSSLGPALPPSDLTRLLAIIGGLITALVGLLGAGLLRRHNSAR